MDHGPHSHLCSWRDHRKAVSCHLWVLKRSQLLASKPGPLRKKAVGSHSARLCAATPQHRVHWSPVAWSPGCSYARAQGTWELKPLLLLGCLFKKLNMKQMTVSCQPCLSHSFAHPLWSSSRTELGPGSRELPAGQP